MQDLPTIRLASTSPRRKELLESLDLQFTTHAIDYDESFPEGLGEKEVGLTIVKKKLAAAKMQITEPGIILCADTTVILDNKILEKPVSSASANAMLNSLSGREHAVYTAVALSDGNKEVLFTDKSIVHFDVIPPEAIEYYVSRYEPFDKAGSYAIQEWIGHAFIKQIEGTYTTIMGLPTHKVYAELLKW